MLAKAEEDRQAARRADERQRMAKAAQTPENRPGLMPDIDFKDPRFQNPGASVDYASGLLAGLPTKPVAKAAKPPLSPRGCVCACETCERLHIIERLAEVPPDAAADLAAAGEASLSPDELARVDALAAERGITRQEAIVLCLLVGAGRPAND